MLKNILLVIIPLIIIFLTIRASNWAESKIKDEPNGGKKTDLSVFIPIAICLVCFFFIAFGLSGIIHFLFFS